MMQEMLLMEGYGAYVWSAFGFTLINFAILYKIVKTQYVKEQKRFNAKFQRLSFNQKQSAKNQQTYREVLSNIAASKI
mgnify:CR=1 FL=1|tara:strand:+ start:166 stop:399 length:234 start_codon:yes stop_codon:yes gene_type:complete